MEKPYSVIILGSGNIGAFYDKPDSEHILSYGHAVNVHSGFYIKGFYDIDYNRALSASQIWGGKAYKDIQTVSGEEVDIVVIAVPDDYHYEYFQLVQKMNVRAIILEKPVVNNPKHYLSLMQSQYDKPVFVNYSRRYVPEYIQVKKIISELGQFKGGIGYYGKGLLHNGSHMLDLLSYWIGNILRLESKSTGTNTNDKDLTKDAMAYFVDGESFYIKAIDEKNFTIFEMDLMFEKGRISLKNAGFDIIISSVVQNSMIESQKMLKEMEHIETSLGKSMYHLMENVYCFLERGEPVACSLESGLAVVKLWLESNKS